MSSFPTEWVGKKERADLPALSIYGYMINTLLILLSI